MTAINRITRADVTAFRDMCSLNTSMGTMNALNHYQVIATKSAIYPGIGTPFGLSYVAKKLNGEAGEFAEHVGKAERDDNLIGAMEIGPYDAYGSRVARIMIRDLTPERRALLIKEIGDQLWYLSAACNELGTTLSEAALTNLEKLCDRGERDALRGSGDER